MPIMDFGQHAQQLSDVSAAPTLTMAQEFDRASTWSDWHGREYSLREEWAYCNAPARRCEGHTAGVRGGSFTAEQGVAPREMELELLDALRGAEEERRTTKRRTPVSIWGDMGFLL